MGAPEKAKNALNDRHDRESFFCDLFFTTAEAATNSNNAQSKWKHFFLPTRKVLLAASQFQDHISNIIFASYFSCTVDGLPLNEFRVLAEKSATAPEYRDEKNRRVEFATPTFNVLNALEQMGYRVVTSGAFVTGHNKFDQREFVWTLHRSTSEMECQ